MTANQTTSDAFERLKKILALEKRQAYRNKAVIGGLDKFAIRWEQDARREVPGQAANITAIVGLLSSYPAIPDQETRARRINDILSRLSLPPAAESTAAPAPHSAPARPAAPRGTPAAPRSTPAGQTSRPPAGEPSRPPAKSPPTARPAKPKSTARPEPAPPKPPPAEAAGEPAVRERRPTRRKAKPLSVAEAELGLQTPVTSLPSIGPHYAELLARLGVHTVEDMLWLLPRRYVDYSHLQPISNLRQGDDVTVLATVWEVSERRMRSGQMAAMAIVADGSGTLQAIWYNPYVLKQLKRDRLIALSGRVDLYMGRFVLNNPEWEPLDQELVHTGRLVPVYPLTKDLSQRWLRQRIKQAVDAWANRVVDFLPERTVNSARLMPLPRALQLIHFPENAEQMEQARRRMAFNDMLLLQLGMQRQRRQWCSHAAQPLVADVTTFLNTLPFTLTDAQTRTLNEVLHDMQQTLPMSRLLQGDVGSGKTAVAAAAMWVAAMAGSQAALMVPTEILAEQHFRSLCQLFAPWSAAAEPSDRPRLTIALLTGSLKESEKEQIRQQLAAGEIDLVVGTHALIQEEVRFARLGLAIVDEQHRFGVEQRAALKQRQVAGAEVITPHLLVMSATPIPRSLALTLYGDLDVSVIDELPPGRQSIRTYVVHPLERERAYSYIERQVEAGRQAYIVCPLVEESEQSDARAAVAEHERLQNTVFPRFKLGMLHGRLRADEKEAVMHQFAQNDVQILVSTSVVEVGIDVPNATVMLVEGANHFGLAQLHQFRGRVGRGEHASACLLLVERADQTEDERLRAMAETQDGFKLAEIDLQLRGPGDFFGTRQSGLPPVSLASFADLKLLEKTRQEAQRLLDADPTLSTPENRALAGKLEAFWRGAGDVN